MVGRFNAMTVGELRHLLKDLPEDMPVVETRYSDYGPMDLSNWEVIEVIPTNNREWFTRLHPSMDGAKQSKKITVLHFSGN